MGDHFDLWKLPLTRGRHGRCRAATGLAAGRTRHPPRRDAPAWQPAGLRRDGDGRRPAQPAASPGRDARRVRPFVSRRTPCGERDGPRSVRTPVMSRSSGRWPGAPPGLWLLDLAQGSVRALAARSRPTRATRHWSRDGSRVYFETGEDTDVVLQAMRVQDGGTEIVARLADGAHTLLRPRRLTRRHAPRLHALLGGTARGLGPCARRRHRHPRRAPRRRGGVSGLVARRTGGGRRRLA